MGLGLSSPSQSNVPEQARLLNRLPQPPPPPPPPPEPTALKDAVEVPALSFEVPVTIWSAAVFLPALVDRKDWVLWFECAFIYLLCALNLLAQLYFLNMCLIVYNEHIEIILSEDCEELADGAVLACIAVHQVQVLKDIMETGDLFFMIWRHIPTSPDMMKYTKNAEGQVELVSGGLSLMRKWMTCIFIITPKFLIAILLSFVGGGFLAVSPDAAELLLNCVALLFILDVDELIFNCFLAKHYRTILASMPPVEIKTIDYSTLVCQAFSGLGKLLLIAAVVFSQMLYNPRCGYPNPPGNYAGFMKEAKGYGDDAVGMNEKSPSTTLGSAIGPALTTTLPAAVTTIFQKAPAWSTTLIPR